MDRAEELAIESLGERDVWGVDELPEGVDVDILRCLDELGLVRVRCVVMQNTAQYRGDPRPWDPTPKHWQSPIRDPLLIGTWDRVMTHNLRDERHHPYEVSLSDAGRAARSRIRRASELEDAGGSSSPPGSQSTLRPVRKPDGWTRSELIAQVEVHLGSFGGSTFDRIRKEAGLPPAERGGVGQQRRFSNAEIRKLISAVKSGNFRRRGEIAQAWQELLDI